MRISTYLRCVLVLVAAAIATVPAFGENAIMLITGERQGFIAGDDTSKASSSGQAITVIAVNIGVNVPIDAASGLPTGRRTYQPIQIVKLPDKASVKLLTAAVTNERLKSVEIRFFRPSTTGANVLYHTFKLTNAQISSYNQGGDTRSQGGVSETLSLTFQSIEVVDNVNGTVASDTWPCCGGV